jgi:hypothetical protein
MGSLADLLTVALGLTLVYLLLSTITSFIQEWISSRFNLRASNLADAIQLLLQPTTQSLAGMKTLKASWKTGQNIWDQGVGSITADVVKNSLENNPLYTFYAHPIIKTLSKPGKLPSYISATDFSTTIFDIFLKAGTQETTGPEQFLESLEESINSLSNNDLKLSVLPYIQTAKYTEGTAEAKIAMARKNIEAWFNSTMDRASGWYKRRMQLFAFIISFTVVIVFNADTLAIVQRVWHDAGLRQSINALATAYADKNKTPDADQVLGQLDTLSLPIGWSGKVAPAAPSGPVSPQDFPGSFTQFLLKALGLAISGLAVSQGSAVWFDLLGKIIDMRNSGVKPAGPPIAKQPSS